MAETTSSAVSFQLGCNYWASHAGAAMWSDWRPDVVKNDFKLLQKTGVNTVRVFPLWPDFQPIHRLYGGGGFPREYRFGEEPLPPGEWGQAGISADAMGHFALLADLASQYNLQLIPGLITGWMSGRLFVPPALEGKNILCDPIAIMWQVRFIRAFVRHFRGHPAIVAWDLGNECNCLAQVGTREAAWSWTATIANAIRAGDSTRPVISGMHSLSTAQTAHWHIEDQGELTDVLTVHPYPVFTPHCDRDPVNTMRSALHATAESAYYADIGGKPCFAEEVGTLGQNIASDKIAADYLRNVLFSLWSHGSEGLLWWCGFDQGHLEKAPYDWCSVERELGLFRLDMTPKPVADEITRFSQFLQKAPVLPPRLREAVCILTEGQDTWSAAYSSFILAKQAGFDLQFQTATQPLRNAELYLLPSLCDQPSRRFCLELSKRVSDGATLYVSVNNALLSGFAEWFGLEVQTRQQRATPATIQFGDHLFTIPSTHRLNLKPLAAEVIAAESDGNPAFTRHAYGKGTIYFLSVPLETQLSLIPDAFRNPRAPYAKFYSTFSFSIRRNRAVEQGPPHLGVTEHLINASSRYVTLINYSPEPFSLPLKLKLGWKINQLIHGDCDAQNNLLFNANDAIVMKLSR